MRGQILLALKKSRKIQEERIFKKLLICTNKLQITRHNFVYR